MRQKFQIGDIVECTGPSPVSNAPKTVLGGFYTVTETSIFGDWINLKDMGNDNFKFTTDRFKIIDIQRKYPTIRKEYFQKEQL